MNFTGRTDVYWPMIRNSIDYGLSQMDREPFSNSFGSFSRYWWAWKFTDFPPVMNQTWILPLCQVWSRKLPDNPFYQNEQLLEWLKGAILYVVRNQQDDGGYDSVGPNARDHGVTLAMVYILCEAKAMLHPSLDMHVVSRMETCVRKALKYARRSRENYAFISNHQALFALAWLKAYEWLGDVHDLRKADSVVEKIISRQHSEGWYPEYGGADPGYETLGLGYLSKYYISRRIPQLLDSMRKSVEFLMWCVQANGSLGGNYSSRGTKLFFPSGIEYLSSYFSEAAAIAGFFRKNLACQNVVVPSNCDSENLPVIAANYLEAACWDRPVFETEESSETNLPCEIFRGSKDFPGAGLWVAGKSGFYGCIGVIRGGVFDFSNSLGSEWASAGYGIEWDGNKYVSQHLGEGELEFYRDKGNEIKLKCRTRFMKMNNLLNNPLRFLVLRLLNLTAFRVPGLGELIRKAIIDKLIVSRSPGPFELEREFEIDQEKMVVRDKIKKVGKTGSENSPLRLFHFSRLTSYHMGSAKYYHRTELNLSNRKSLLNSSQKLQISGEAELAQTITWHKESTDWVEGDL